MSDISAGRDFSVLDAAVAELLSAVRYTPPGGSVRIQVRGKTDDGREIDPNMPIAVMKLLQQFPTKLRAVKWAATNGAVVGSPDAAAFVTIMRTHDLYASYDKEERQIMGDHGHILSGENASDLDFDLVDDVDFVAPITPKIKIIGDGG